MIYETHTHMYIYIYRRCEGFWLMRIYRLIYNFRKNDTYKTYLNYEGIYDI